MWNLDFERIQRLVPLQPVKVAVETGTCRGNGTRALAKIFDRVITIELQAELLRLARAKLAGFKNIEFREGNSAEVLKEILPGLESEAVFFFLDAHWSGDQSVNWEKSGWKGYGLDTAHLGRGSGLPSGPEQVPLLGEMSAIANFFHGPAILLIDDMKNIPPEGAGKINGTFAGEDWSHLTRDLLRETVRERLHAEFFLENPDQWLLVLKAKGT